jgi:hypothetical protein
MREGEASVSALCFLFKQSQPCVSHHLSGMWRTGLVQSRRVGQRLLYQLGSADLADQVEQSLAEAGGSTTLECQDFTLTFMRRQRQ